jgi:hypothetical protein
MRYSVIPYREMCRREGTSLHRRLNHGIGGDHSTILELSPSQAPCDGPIVILEGHDEPRKSAVRDPRRIDQPELFPDGRFTQNGRFHRAAQGFKAGCRPPERVRIYEKLDRGVWVYLGVHHLIDSWREAAGPRMVFKFKLLAVVGDEDFAAPPSGVPDRRREIPRWVRLRVWRRDGRKCAACGAEEELRFCDVAPCAGAGTPADPEQIRLLCVHHSLLTSEAGTLGLPCRASR